ncbi:MAG TPA: DUF1707 domain-containing protein [Micromonosporaceae bacterium]
MTMPSNPGQIRASDQEREAVVAKLNAAVGDGRLSIEEFSDRVGAAYAARTQDDLTRLLADLPAAGTSGQVVPAGGKGAEAQIWDQPGRPPHVTPFGSLRRSGAWRIDPDTKMGVVFGSVKLDLRGAYLSAPEVTLAVEVVFGSVKIWVPKGLRTEVEGNTVFGGRRIEENHLPMAAGGPLLRLRIDTVFGSVRVHRV